MAQNVEIVLTVEVDSIRSLENPTEEEILKYFHLSDGANNSDKNLKDFLTDVHWENWVKWKV